MALKFPTRMLASQDDAALIENANIPRSTFINQWTRKTAFDAGKLYPILVEEILPGDHMTYNVTAHIRMATPAFPLFDQQRIDTHFFFVPCRLIWDNWVKMMGEQADPTDTINYTVPQVVTQGGGEPVGSLYDHMGVPGLGQLAAAISINALPLRAYNLIYNQWFRDENLTTPATFSRADGPDTRTWYTIQPRAKSHDYFTSALPWPQKFTAPSIPLVGLAPITGFGSLDLSTHAGPFTANETGGTTKNYAFYKGPLDATTAADRMYVETNGGYPAIYANLAAASGVSINALRQAWMVQSLLERDARGGTRYIELIRSHFGVINPDFRLQRAEYIGGGQTPFSVTPIAASAVTTGVPIGTLGAAATSAGTHHASYAATEHGYIIGLISVKSELSYQQGLDKLWTRGSRLDFYMPAMAQLGEQAILNGEIYKTGTGTDITVFGYQERWQEYRTRQSDVVGILRSTAPATIDQWHLAEKFTALPVLNTAFINETPPMARVLVFGAAEAGKQYIGTIFYHRTAIRPIPTYGTPAILGRF